MVEHLVMFKFVDGTDETQLEAVTEGLRSLRTKVPGILELTAGRNFTQRARGYHLGLLVRLRDREALAGYGTHPEHLRVVETLIKPHLDELIVLDYEV